MNLLLHADILKFPFLNVVEVMNLQFSLDNSSDRSAISLLEWEKLLEVDRDNIHGRQSRLVRYFCMPRCESLT